MSILLRIQSAVREGNYELTEHAVEEAEADGFGPLDVRHALLHSRLIRRYTHDPRGPRYKLCGPSIGGTLMYLVCRFTELRGVRVITVFAVRHEQ